MSAVRRQLRIRSRSCATLLGKVWSSLSWAAITVAHWVLRQSHQATGIDAVSGTFPIALTSFHSLIAFAVLTERNQRTVACIVSISSLKILTLNTTPSGTRKQANQNSQRSTRNRFRRPG